jgi:ferredoxin
VAKNKKRDVLGIVRPIVQLGFAGYVFAVAIQHGTSTTETGSLHAFCPFGAVESLWSLIVGGKYLPKIHSSSIVLSVGLLISAILVGAAFCGWICPLGSLGDLLSWVRRKLRLPEVQVPTKVDTVLRYGRYVVLAGILYATVTTAKLWFAEYDPYHVLFGLGWIFEFDLATQWPGYLITLGIIGGSLVIPRLWCRYLCPLGGLLSLIQRLSPIKIRRDAEVCINCKRCDKVCPAKLDVSTNRAVTHDCTMCLRCTGACPAAGALDASLRGYEDKSAPGGKARPFSHWIVPTIAVVALLASAPVGSALGFWQTTGKSLTTLTNPTLDDIKGSSSLAEVSTTFNIPKEELYKILGLPADIALESKLKDLESYNEVSTVRSKVAAYLGISYESTEAPSAQPTATTAPSQTGQVLPAAEIKGSMTLQEVVAQCAIPQDVLYKELKLDANVPLTTTLKALPTFAPGLETTQVRDVVTAYQAKK